MTKESYYETRIHDCKVSRDQEEMKGNVPKSGDKVVRDGRVGLYGNVGWNKVTNDCDRDHVAPRLFWDHNRRIVRETAYTKPFLTQTQENKDFFISNGIRSQDIMEAL